LAKLAEVPRALFEPLALMVSAYAPHLGEELWERLGHTESVSQAEWPRYDEALAADQDSLIVVQVNGKLRDKFTVPAGTAVEELERQAQALPGVRKWLEGRAILKVIAVPDKLVNIVVK
ncbi:MAG: class I tRNA ligase family protein, partial [Spirochaetaceae bacterium]|nr:class I tRNA ligase family protein [Spirochaetaceae bacterium]MDR0568703.1 class I tRNA ligase family protein [Spirochaetaceae bacterium]